jgi:uncharacterized membrane protein YfcA
MELVLTVAAGAMVAGFVQGLSGFAFGLTAMSIWAWTLQPQLAAALTVFGALTGQLIAAATVRRAVDRAQLLPFVFGGLVGIPIGVALLPRLDTLLFKAALGGFLVLWCPAMLLAGRLPTIRAGRLADAVVGAIGGVMGGIGGFAGTAPTLWCTLRGYAKDEQRAIVQNFNLAMQLFTMLGYLARGLIHRPMLPLFAVAAGAMLLPSLLGARLYVGISAQAFNRVVLGLLTASGVALLAASLPGLLQRV